MAATTLAADITISTKTFEVADGSTLTKGTYIDIDGEEMFIKTITGNKITVNRGQDGSTISIHLGGSR
jgi:ATP-dependent protease Clp ATPase subunit